jgi:hypothetical protein
MHIGAGIAQLTIPLLRTPRMCEMFEQIRGHRRQIL